MRAIEFITESQQSTKQFMDYINSKYPMKSFSLHDYSEDTIKLSSIIVDNKKHGIGSSVMNELIHYADSMNKCIILDVGVKDDYHGTTSRNRLVKFYKRFGFYENKGRNKDFSISAGMIRDPQATVEHLS